MSANSRWLRSEIEQWQQEGLIDDRQAGLLLARYPAPAGRDGWGRVIFSALGALIFGLGIILLFAYNWEAMHRFAKLASIGAGLLGAHAAGWWLMRPGGAHPRLGESLHLLGSLLFGAGIWLVAQIYHIDEHYPNAFLVWSLGALALAWAIPSTAQGALALALVLIWAWAEVFDFQQGAHLGPWLVALGVLPLAWQRRATALLAAGLIGFLLLFAFSLGRVNDDAVFTALFLLAGSYLGLARLAPHWHYAESAAPLTLVGGATYLFMLFLCTFADIGEVFEHDYPQTALGWLYWLLPLAAAAATWLAQLRWRPPPAASAGGRWEPLLIVLALATVGFGMLSARDLGAVIWVAFNLLFAAHALLYIERGTRELRWPLVLLGCLMLGAQIFARFTDLFDSLLLRAAVFVLAGAGLFAVGHYYSRQKARQQATQQRTAQQAEAPHHG